MAESVTYPIAPNGIFLTCQGEGHLLGTPMAFVRLAGCDVNCPGCDTNYGVHERLTDDAIMERVIALGNAIDWVFLTGGEPTLHDWGHLAAAFKRAGYRVGLATAGEREIPDWWDKLDYLYVSPHRPDRWMQACGSDLNVVPGVNGHGIKDFAGRLAAGFGHRYVTPCDGRPETLQECVEWVCKNPGWRLGVQAHKQWGMP